MATSLAYLFALLLLFTLSFSLHDDDESDLMMERMNNVEARLSRLESQLKQCQEEKRSDKVSAIPNWGYINAANSPYNAKGDGTTDDTKAIQSALNDASSTGGFVLLPGWCKSNQKKKKKKEKLSLTIFLFRRQLFGFNSFDGSSKYR